MILLDYDIGQLLYEVKSGKKLIAFGAGRFLENFCIRHSEYELERYIYKIIDNNTSFIGNIKKIGIHNIPIIGIKEGLKDLEDGILLITNIYLDEIAQQLAEYNVQKFAFLGYVEDKLIEQKMSSRAKNYYIVDDNKYFIPKVIHYCWFGKGKIPGRYREWMKSWKKYCPDYEIVEWNESNYDVYKNRYMAEAYEAKKWGFVPDYARLDIIYNHGGMYLDTDVEIIKSFDAMLHQAAFAGIQTDGRVAFGLGFGSVAGNPIMKTLRDDYSDKRFLKQDGSLDMVASPTYQTKRLKKYGLRQDAYIIQRLKYINIYPSVFFTPMTPFTRKIIANEMYSYSIHHYDGSWIDDARRRRIRSYCDIFKK